MAYRTQLSGYVKFLRGTPAAWESIETKDSDTLYFIAEPGASTGKLYLGNKLISGGGSSIGDNITLGDLQDVLIRAQVPSNAVLVYNENSQIWEPVALETALATVVYQMVGATATDNGLGGLVPQPLAGEQNLFLRGDATWADPTALLRADLYAGDTGSIRSIATSVLNQIVGNAPTSLDTLEELATWVQNHEQILDIAQAAQDIEYLNDSMFGTLANPAETHAQLVQMVQQEGVIRILSNLNTIILGDGQTTGLQSIVSSLGTTVVDHTNAINLLNAAMADVEDDIAEVADRLRWVDVVEDNSGE